MTVTKGLAREPVMIRMYGTIDSVGVVVLSVAQNFEMDFCRALPNGGENDGKCQHLHLACSSSDDPQIMHQLC